MIEKLFADFVFVVLVVITMAGALTTALVRRPIYPFLGLVTTMFGVAGLYVFLNAPFIAMMQILIYVGAVAILIAFGIMLTGPYAKKDKDKLHLGKLVGAVVVSLAAFFVMLKMLSTILPVRVAVRPFVMTTKDIGKVFFDRMNFPFELISLLIVVSILGAVMLALIARRQR
jgi:NADH:ubiquinone oxidoreductase subunit 6 (subunit J)